MPRVLLWRWRAYRDNCGDKCEKTHDRLIFPEARPAHSERLSTISPSSVREAWVDSHDRQRYESVLGLRVQKTHAFRELTRYAAHVEWIAYERLLADPAGTLRPVFQRHNLTYTESWCRPRPMACAAMTAEEREVIERRSGETCMACPQTPHPGARTPPADAEAAEALPRRLGAAAAAVPRARASRAVGQLPVPRARISRGVGQLNQHDAAMSTPLPKSSHCLRTLAPGGGNYTSAVRQPRRRGPRLRRRPSGWTRGS